jgi:glycosyltransferase involved in cell wall biosynthesis
VRIAVTAVAAKKSGGSTLILEKLIEALPRVAPEHEYRFFVSQEFAEGRAAELSNEGGIARSTNTNGVSGVELVAVRHDSLLRRLRWDQITYRSLLEEFRADISVNALGFGPLFPGIPQCTFLQDSTYFCAMRRYQRSTVDRARTQLQRWLLTAVMKNSARIVVPSDALADSVSKAAGRLAPKIVVLRDPFEAEYIDPRSRTETLDPPSGNIPATILYLSHLEPHKAHSFLPDVASELRRLTSTPIRFIVAIDRRDSPRLYDEFLRKVELTGTADVFEIRSRMPYDEVPLVFQRSHVFFFPSLCESFGYPMAEAGAAGLPVVAADTAVNREMLGEDALYFEPGRADKAAEALSRLITDEPLRIQCAVGIQRHQRSILPGWEEYARRFVEIVVGAVDAD